MTAPGDDLPELPEPIGYVCPDAIRCMNAGVNDTATVVRKEDATLEDPTHYFASVDVGIYTADQVRLAVQQDRERRQEAPSEQDRMSLWTDIDHYVSVALGPDKAAFLAARNQLAQAIDRLVSDGGRQEALSQNLKWSDPAPPNGNSSFYNNVAAETPFGQFVITWKSWKDFPSFDIDAPFEWSDGAYRHSNLDAAKGAAETEFTRRIAICSAGAADEARDAAQLREAMARLLAWGGIGSQNWSTVVAFGVIDWAKSGATGPLPELPDYAEADVAAMRAAIAAHQPKAGT